MNLYKKNIPLVFLAVLALTLFVPNLFPLLKINYFFPFIVILFYRTRYASCLFASLGCGLILDLLSPHSSIGLYSINFTLTTALLYGQKRHFFADSITTLPIMTFFYSVISTLLQAALLTFFEKPIIFSYGWIFKDVVLLSGADMLFAFFAFIFPFLLFGKPVRKGKDYFLNQD